MNNFLIYIWTFIVQPPGFQNRVFADEELAIMLQNELFQREVRAMFGDEFVRQAAGGNTTQQGLKLFQRI